MSTSTIEDIQSRIAQIQQRLGLQTQAQTTSSTSGASFSDTLSSLINGMGSNDSINSNDLLTMLSGDGDAGNGAVTGDSVVQDASQYLGVPYKWGGTDPSSGLDCSGLVQHVYGDLGISMPRLAADQAKQGTPVASLAQAQPGDLVAFHSPVNHIGIYIGDNKMIVAPKTGDVVKVEDVYTTPTAIRRIIPSTGQSTIASQISSLTNDSATGTVGNDFGALSSQYNDLFTAAGNKYGISPVLLAAVAKQESGFNSSAQSGAGAQGLMQLMPGTARSLGVNAFNPSEAIDGAAKMLSGLQTQFGSTSLALAAYNAGPGAVQKYNGIPPYSETQNYVKNILAMANTGAIN